MAYRLGFIGAGAMAGGIVTGIIEKGLLRGEDILMADPSEKRLAELRSALSVAVTANNDDVLAQCAMVILAIKPQHFAQMALTVPQPGPVVISIMAGVPIAGIAQKMGQLPIARIMPNIPAQIACSMSAICGNEQLSAEQLAQVVALFDCVGETIVIKENQMDAVCGLSGSGPAFMFMVIEALADGGVMMGLPRDVAYKLAAQTMVGSGKMVLETGKHPAVLKDMVTSPGGTTIMGMAALEQAGVRSAMMAAVREATLQSKKLGEMI